MALAPVLVLASVAVPLVLLLGGLAVLVVGLAFLFGERDRGRVDDTANVEVDGPGSAPCDWAAWLATEDGDPVLLRTPMGRPCCVHVVRIRDLDAAPPSPDVDEILTWSGDATTIGPDDTRTALRRATVQRRWRVADGGLGVDLAVVSAPGAVVATGGWGRGHRPDGESAPATGTAPEAWRRHLDALHDMGARADDGPPRGTANRGRRIEVTLTVVDGCDRAHYTSLVEGECRVRKQAEAEVATGSEDSTGAGPGPRVVDHSRAWLLAGNERVEVGPGGDDSLHVQVDGGELRLELGSTVEVDLAAPGGPEPPPVSTSASTAGRVRVTVGDDEHTNGNGDEEGNNGCTRCLPRFEVMVGTDRTVDARPAHTHSRVEGSIRLDGREVALRRPDPDGTDTCWALAEDLSPHPVTAPDHEST